MSFSVISWFSLIVFLLPKCGYDNGMRPGAAVEGPVTEFLLTYLYLILLVPIKHRDKTDKPVNTVTAQFPSFQPTALSLLRASKQANSKWTQESGKHGLLDFSAPLGCCGPVPAAPRSTADSSGLRRPAGWRPHGVTPMSQPGLRWRPSFCLWQVTALKPSFLVTEEVKD